MTLAFRLLLALLGRLPLSASYAAASALDRAVPRLRRIGERNLTLAMPELSAAQRKAIVDEVYRNIGRILHAFSRFPRINQSNVREWIEYAGFEHFEEAKKAGKGVLFATAHLGNWELSAFSHALLAEPMFVVVRPLDNAGVDDLVETRRALSGNTILGKRDAARAIVKALRSNEAVGILVDQNSQPDEGVFIDFFGRKACTHAAFAKLAARTGAAVIPGFALWSEAHRKYLLKFYPPIEVSDDVIETTQRLHTHLESVIRQYPGQWLWIHRRWKTRPEGEPPLY